MDNKVDGSGLPTYCEQFCDFASEKYPGKYIHVNVIIDASYQYSLNKRQRGESIVFDIVLPNFMTMYYRELEVLLANILDNNPITHLILPDYLAQEYTENINLRERGIKKILFIHLLNRGMMDAYTKQPYFAQLKSGMEYLSNNAFLEWKAVKTSDIIIVNSKFTEEDLRRFYWDCNLEDKQIVTTPLGVDLGSIPKYPTYEGNSWAYFGRLVVQKGIYYIMKDISLHKEMYKNNPLKIMGEGDFDATFSKGHILDGTVTYYGPLEKDRLWEELKDVKYCIFPSIYEPYGLALNEAMAMGKLCIISNRPSGMMEQVISGVNGISFDFNESIIEYIENRNTDKDKSIIQNAMNSARSIDEHFIDLEEILNEL